MSQGKPADTAVPPSDSRLRRAAADVAAGARTAAPVLRHAGQRIGDWLANVGWGKFFLVAVLLLILGGIGNSVLVGRGPAVVVERGQPHDRVNVTISVSPEGVQIRPSSQVGPAAVPKAPVAPKPPRPPGSAEPAEPTPSSQGGNAIAGSGDAGVRIDDKGVRIVADDRGKRVEIVIDGTGVRIQELAASPRPPGAVIEGRTVTLPPEVTADPEKLARSIEAARDKVEQIVNDQVTRQVERKTRVYQEQTSDWLMSFVFLLIVAGIIVKVVLGSKKKAEVRAQAASQTAAEEGLKRQLVEAQLKMMQAQVEPHFLFNTLASVDYLIETDPARASTMQKNLIQYLRAALPQMREGSTTLGKEVSLCRAYLEILKVRMEDRLQSAITVPQGLGSAQFPPMMLQSLVENAIKHGLEPKPEGGSLTLSAAVSHGVLRVTVADTGRGFGVGATAGMGVGLANVSERLAALYGGRARLLVEANAPSGTIATIEVPYSIDTGAAAGAAGEQAAAQAA